MGVTVVEKGLRCFDRSPWSIISQRRDPSHDWKLRRVSAAPPRKSTATCFRARLPMMIMTRLMRVATTAAIAASAASAAVPRAVRVDGQQFVLAETNASVVLAGPNVVVKGPPYLPSVSGSTICNDVVNDECKALGNCSSCTTFNAADVARSEVGNVNEALEAVPEEGGEASPGA